MAGHYRLATALAALAIAAGLAGCAAPEAPSQDAQSSSAAQHTPSTSRPAPPTPSSAQTPQIAQPPTSAEALLAALPIKGRAPMTGYDRTGQFGPAWKDVDRNGCDTRNDILARDLTNIRRDSNGCTVRAGTLADPYTGTTIAFTRGQATSTAVQIDHVVALADAWQKGAQGWDQTTRVTFANDPANLLAVDGAANQSKGAGDAATWLPKNKAYRCTYVTKQIEVKADYGLWVTQAEHDAMARVLATCPG